MSREPVVKPALTLLYAFLMLFVFTTWGYVLCPFMGRKRAMHHIARGYFRHMTRIWGVEHEIHGLENLPPEILDGRQPVIYIANHTSYLDAMMLTCYLPNHPTFLAKVEMLFIPVLGLACWMGGAIFINRRNRPKAIESLRRAAARIRSGATIAAFPEGTRTKDGRMLPFKKGIFNLAQDAGVPLVPLGLTGGFEMLPSGSLRVEPGTFRIHVGSPIHPSEHPDLEVLRDVSWEAVKALVAKG